MQSQIFITPTQNDLSSLHSDNPSLIANIFSKSLSYDSHDSIMLTMNNTNIFFYQTPNNQTPKLCAQLCFSLKFEIIRQEWRDQNTPGKPIGICFEKDGCEPITFYSNSANVVDSWRMKLQQKINQRGFHKLFKAKRKIGKGAFATVYLAQRLIDKKLVAVKAFSKQKQYSTDKGKDSLVNQLNLMRKLKYNSNIISLEGVFQTQNSIYVILQNLQGGQLHEKIKAGYKFKKHQTIQIMLGILRGLAFMDSKRIIHRDLKPENLLFRNKYSFDIVIADFGLATWAQQPTYLFVRCGTPGFVAPEIINIRDMSTHSDPISDVFSAGLIFHYLLFGKSVFKGTKYAQILAQNRACDFKIFGPQYQNLDRNIYDLLYKMLEVDPRKRIRAQQALNHKLFKNHMQIQVNEQTLQKEISRKNSSSNINSICSSFENSNHGYRISNNIYENSINQLNMMRKTVSNKQNEKILILTPRGSHRRSDGNAFTPQSPLKSPVNNNNFNDFSKKRQNVILSNNSNSNSIHYSNPNKHFQFDRNA